MNDEIEVIRIIQYKGTEAAVRKALSASLPEGVKDCLGYTITIAEYSSNLPPAIELDESEVNDALGGVHCTGHVDYAPTMMGEVAHCCFCFSASCKGECQNEPNR